MSARTFAAFVALLVVSAVVALRVEGVSWPWALTPAAVALVHVFAFRMAERTR